MTAHQQVVIALPAQPRLALSPEEAAAAIGTSRDFFDLHVLPELRVVRRGRKVLVPVRELERWLVESGALTLEVGNDPGYGNRRRRRSTWKRGRARQCCASATRGTRLLITTVAGQW